MFARLLLFLLLITLLPHLHAQKQDASAVISQIEQSTTLDQSQKERIQTIVGIYNRRLASLNNSPSTYDQRKKMLDRQINGQIRSTLRADQKSAFRGLSQGGGTASVSSAKVARTQSMSSTSKPPASTAQPLPGKTPVISHQADEVISPAEDSGGEDDGEDYGEEDYTEEVGEDYGGEDDYSEDDYSEDVVPEESQSMVGQSVDFLVDDVITQSLMTDSTGQVIADTTAKGKRRRILSKSIDFLMKKVVKPGIEQKIEQDKAKKEAAKQEEGGNE
ncbi:MAG: hypothetical protein AAF206_31435 [Bacteroidota bacterium]